MKAALAPGVLLLLAGCGRHDTPVASYQAPIPEQPSGQAGSAGAAGATNDAGGASATGGAGVAGAAGAAGAESEPSCMQTYATIVPGLTSRYKEGTTGQSWANAERDCETEGGHLIVIDDAAENDWMKSIAAKSMTDSSLTNQQAWIGLGDSATEETFEWVTGAPLTVALWADMEPNDRYNNEDCVQVGATGSWNDDSCEEPLAYVCECDGTPSAELWCDSQANETCGDCNSPCQPDQTCVNSTCQ